MSRAEPQPNDAPPDDERTPQLAGPSAEADDDLGPFPVNGGRAPSPSSLRNAGPPKPIRPALAGPRFQDTIHANTLITLFILALRLSLRPLRLLIIFALFTLPLVIIGIMRMYSPYYVAADTEFKLVFEFLPHTLVPLCALLFSAGVVQDELENQTLTYLLIRPIWRPAIFATKLLAMYVVTVVFTAVFTQLMFAVTHLPGTPDYFTTIAVSRAPLTALIYALILAAYCGVFGLLSVVSRWSLSLGVMYIIVIEGVFANMDFALRQLTIIYYFRALCCYILGIPWNGDEDVDWNLDPEQVPSLANTLLILGGVAVTTTLLGSFLFASREYRVKTPESS